MCAYHPTFRANPNLEIRLASPESGAERAPLHTSHTLVGGQMRSRHRERASRFLRSERRGMQCRPAHVFTLRAGGSARPIWVCFRLSPFRPRPGVLTADHRDEGSVENTQPIRDAIFGHSDPDCWDPYFQVACIRVSRTPTCTHVPPFVITICNSDFHGAMEHLYSAGAFKTVRKG